MSLDVVCYYADLGRPYAPLLAQMTQSAKRVMPDCRTVLMTPNAPGHIHDLFDASVELTGETTAANLCLERARATVSWAIATSRRTIFADPDVEFRKAPPFDGSFDVGLLWRTKVDQPVNTGIVLAEPGFPAFWKHYGSIVANLPKVLRPWFCDQLGFALLTGVCRAPDERLTVDDARLWLMEAKRHCYKPDTVTAEAWAVHYKGRAKGAGWEHIFKGDTERSQWV